VSDTDEILKALREHRSETRQDMHELRGAVVKIADAASEMGKTMARSEERHQQHDDNVMRIGRAIDDHEERVRHLEHEEQNRPTMERCRTQAVEIQKIKDRQLEGRSSVTGGWKVLTVMGALVAGITALVAALFELTT